MIAPAFISDLLARADIVEIIGRRVPLKKTGINHKGLCPFHAEKTPSFTVNASRQTYHCFGCGAHGNAIGFLIEESGMGFIDAVHELAQQVGMAVPEDDTSPEQRAQAARLKERQGSLGEVLSRAAAHYRAQLKASPTAIDYLKRRGLTGAVAARFGIGYAPEGWRSLASAFARYDDPLLEESGLVIVQGHNEADQKRYDRFRDRIMFPIRSVRGDMIGFGGRVIDQGEPKYLNSPETPLFSKGRELYGLHEARSALRERGCVLVVEGYMDVVALAQLGFPNAVATLGTACTAEHVQKLFRYTDSVVFSFDGDAAGRRAAGRALEASLAHATDTRTVRFLFLPSEHDPDSYIREHGSAAFTRCIDRAVPLSRQLVEAAREGSDLGQAEGRARFLAQAKPLWLSLPSGALRSQLLGELAEEGRLGRAELAALWGQPATALPAARRRRVPYRTAPRRPADNVARLLLLSSHWWHELGHAEHELLHASPDWQGELFRWLERQLTEHGSAPWPALREGLAGQPWAPQAQALVEGHDIGFEPLREDLGFALDQMRDGRLREEAMRQLGRA